MTTPEDTRHLIRALTRDAAARRGAHRALPSTLTLAASAGLVLALAIAFGGFGASDHLGRTLNGAWFYRKLGCMAVIGGGAFVVLLDLARPSSRRPPVGALLPALAVMGLAALTDTSSLALGGRATLSVPTCVGAIVLLALPALAVLLLALRVDAAVTRPALTGAVAGLLSGALGGAAYALVCRNDGGLFIAVWYGTAVLCAAGLGAVLGRRTLAW